MEAQPINTNLNLGFDPTGMIIIFMAVVSSLGILVGLGVFLWPFFVGWIKYQDREKNSLQYVLLQVTVPRQNEIKIDAAEQLIGALYAIKTGSSLIKWFDRFKPQPFISFEVVALPESIKFYVACNKKHQDLVEKQINGAYPDAQIKEVPEYNIFSEAGQTAYQMFKLRSSDYLPVKTYKDLPTDPLSALTSALAKMQPGEGAVVQILISPADGKWKDSGKKFLKKEKDPGDADKPKAPPDAKQLEAVEGKLAKSGFETVIRMVVSSTSKESAKMHVQNIRSAFEQFNGPFNGFAGMKIRSEKGFIKDFIYRYPPRFDKLSVMTADEIASVFHFPNKSVETPHIQWLPAKSAPAPDLIPTSGLYIGKSRFRGAERAVYMSDYDRQRHMYIIGRTGSGKTELLKSMMLQDILNGKGLCFIDPHGDAAEEILQLIPASRAQDVIYFDPSDTDRPFGMNMLESYSEEHKHLVVASIIGLMYKLFDPQKTGIIGPRFEHGVRNAMLTAMSKPGNTFMEVVRVMTDPEFVKELLPLVQDPVVRRYWTDQIAQTSDFHKSEVLDYTVSKFGRFVTNVMMRNIIGQSKSSFDLRNVMDTGKILIVNLSKGRMGEENSNFLGLVLVPKILFAAMSRANIPESQRRDFYLYVDEFQNFATDTFADILAEARKYKLNLIVANQFIGQIGEDLKNAVFGNVGTIAAFRVGVTDANFLQHEFAPVFSEQDLVQIEAFHIYMKTQVRGQPVPPFSVDTTKDLKAWQAMIRADVGRAIKELSRLTFGRDKKMVEADIAERSKL
ncbi:type IV secretion system DNA-binding domain-containing protein [Candidatus Daviesbacteria bacterium]|nr:type IV secretion system DNA-binding domain-containing protein [Candidatus Daviesbacteria bacterium]